MLPVEANTLPAVFFRPPLRNLLSPRVFIAAFVGPAAFHWAFAAVDGPAAFQWFCTQLQVRIVRCFFGWCLFWFRHSYHLL